MRKLKWRGTMLLLIDNYDSFTYNLFQYFGELGEQVIVRRNDKLSLDDIKEMHPEYIVISPGPSTPVKAGISNEVIRHYGTSIPVLGVCLGHECIGYSFGGTICQAAKIMHGKASLIHHRGRRLFAGIPVPFSAIRYHSLVIDHRTLPECFEVTAWTDEGTIMGISHRRYPIEGVQFHPESFMTQYGKQLLNNFLKMREKYD